MMKPHTMTVRELLRDLTGDPVPPISVTGIASHSKQVRPGELFIALRGPNADGHGFLDEAVKRGAVAIVVEQAPEIRLPCPVIRVADAQKAIAEIAARFYGRPVERLRMVGITGTCGKTTTSYMTRAMLQAAGQRVGLIGTVAYEIGQRYVPSTNTTPGPLALQQLLAQMIDQGLQWCVMEVSSHALDQRRIEGLAFDAAVWTCLGSDHLDYHKTLEQYANAKRKIFTYLRRAPVDAAPREDRTVLGAGRSVINLDDPYGQTLAETLTVKPMVTYGVESVPPDCVRRTARPTPMVNVRVLTCSWEGMQLVVESPWGVFPVETSIVGRHNVSNIAAACATVLGLGVWPSAIQEALAQFPQVPGRLERVANDAGVQVIVDFAHTADALHRTMLALRELVRGRLVVVFGCGGDRDQLKRPAMGQVASLLSDYVILTADNPRSEDPQDIIHQIKSGFVPGFRDFSTVVDREEAITKALSMAHPDDAVLIAGKGHEAYQIFQHTHIPFSDREVVERFFARAKPLAV